MRVVQIDTHSDDLHELGESEIACRHPRSSWCEVAGDNVHGSARTGKHAEIASTAQVGIRIDLLNPKKRAVRRHQEVRVSSWQILRRGALRVATVAISGHIG